MKSKTVASILRHVATKLPSFDADNAAEPADPTAPTKSKRGPKGGTHQGKTNGPPAEVAEGAEGETVEGSVFVEPGSSEEERLEKLYETIAWPLSKKYSHPYEAFKLALTCVLFFSSPSVSLLTISIAFVPE